MIKAFSVLQTYIICGHARKCLTLSIIFCIIYELSKLYRQIVGNLMGTNCASFVVVDFCFLFCYVVSF